MMHSNIMSEGRQKFSDEANMVYTRESVESLIGDTDKLVELIQHHQNHQRPRLKTLREYYKGNNESILQAPEGQRRKEKKMADNRATHNFAKYVSQFIQGYVVGVPLKTSYEDDEVNEALREINRTNDADEHNSDLVLDQSIYGRAYEMLFRSQNDETRFVSLDVLETFVVYDDTIEAKPLMAIRYIGKQFEDDIKVYLYTHSDIYEYSLDLNNEMTFVDIESHYFGGVPIIEYSNNKYRQGDFEDVLTLIDLYDNAQSDTANYMQDLNDAMLLIKGPLDIDIPEAEKMKESNIIFLQSEPTLDGRDSQVDARYIYKQYDVAGTEAYKDRIFQNILLFTSIPNLLDDTSSGQQSGEAIKMKLFALSQKRATKERLFKKSLRDRYRLISNISSILKEVEFDTNEISITFTENLPSMIAKDMDWFTSAGGRLSNQTMLENLPFVENAEEELEKIEAEDNLNKDLYLFDTNNIPEEAKDMEEDSDKSDE